MPASVGVGGVNRAIIGVWVGVGGAWRPVGRGDVGVGGVWRNAIAAITLNDTYTVADASISPANATASFELNTDGNINTVGGAGAITAGQWTVPGNDASQFEVVATLTSGAVSSGSFGTLNLGTTRLWSRTQSVVGSASVHFTLAIRRVGTGVTLDSTTVTLDVEETI